MADALRETLASPDDRRTEHTPAAVPIAPGELLDRLTILQIKSERVSDPVKLRGIRAELEALRSAREASLPASEQIEALARELRQVNEQLWEIEDNIRLCERARWAMKIIPGVRLRPTFLLKSPHRCSGFPSFLIRGHPRNPRSNSVNQVPHFGRGFTRREGRVRNAEVERRPMRAVYPIPASSLKEIVCHVRTGPAILAEHYMQTCIYTCAIVSFFFAPRTPGGSARQQCAI